MGSGELVRTTDARLLAFPLQEGIVGSCASNILFAEEPMKCVRQYPDVFLFFQFVYDVCAYD